MIGKKLVSLAKAFIVADAYGYCPGEGYEEDVSAKDAAFIIGEMKGVIIDPDCLNDNGGSSPIDILNKIVDLIIQHEGELNEE